MLRLAALVSLLTGLVAVPSAAAASTHRHRHHAVAAALSLSATQPGASIMYQARAQDLVAIAMAPPVSRAALQLPPSFVAAHSARVQRDMIYFAPEIPVGDLPALPNERTLKPPVTSPFVFVQTPPSADLLQVMRDRDRLRLWSRRRPMSIGIGLCRGHRHVRDGDHDGGALAATVALFSRPPRPPRPERLQRRRDGRGSRRPLDVKGNPWTLRHAPPHATLRYHRGRIHFWERRPSHAQSFSSVPI